MPQIKIRIGAVKDRSVDVVFADVEKRGQRAAQNIARHMSKAISGAKVRGTGAGGGGARQRIDEQTRAHMHGVRKRITAERAYERAAHREKLRSIEKEARAKVRATQRERKATERAQRMERERFARRTSHRTTRFLTPNAPIGSMAARGLSGFARGAGVTADLTSMVRRVKDAEDMAIALSTKGFVKGNKGPKGTRIDPAVLQEEARVLAQRYGAQGGTAGILAGQYEFVEQRGNLSGSRAILEPLVKRAVATRTDMADVGKVAAKIDSMLSTQGKYKNNDKLRNEKVIEVVDNMIQQAKVGSIGFSGLAKQIPKISGLSASFSGDVAENLKELTAIVQLAERGPGSNPAVSATMGKNFAIQISKQADKIAEFAGVEVYNESGRKKSPAKLAMDMIAATEGGGTFDGEQLHQEELLNKALPNLRGNLALQELLTTFTGAGGGEKGRAAMEHEFSKEKFGGQYTQLEDDLETAMDSMSNEAERFNAELEKATAQLAERLVPVLKEAVPHIIKFVEGMSKAAAWAVSNPGQAIVAAIVLAIGRAGLESALRTAIERSILGAPGAGVAGGGGLGATPVGVGKGKAGMMMTFGTVVMAAGAGLAIGTAIAEVIDEYLIDEEAMKEGEKTALEKQLAFEEDLKNAVSKAKEGEDLKKPEQDWLKGAREAYEKRIEVAKYREENPEIAALNDAVRHASGQLSDEELGQLTQDQNNVKRLEQQLEQINRLLSGQIRVNVDNMPAKVNEWYGIGGGGGDSGRQSSNQFVNPYLQ